MLDYLITTTSPANGLDMWVIVLEVLSLIVCAILLLCNLTGVFYQVESASNRVALNAGLDIICN